MSNDQLLPRKRKESPNGDGQYSKRRLLGSTEISDEEKRLLASFIRNPYKKEKASGEWQCFYPQCMDNNFSTLKGIKQHARTHLSNKLECPYCCVSRLNMQDLAYHIGEDFSKSNFCTAGRERQMEVKSTMGSQSAVHSSTNLGGGAKSIQEVPLDDPEQVSQPGILMQAVYYLRNIFWKSLSSSFLPASLPVTTLQRTASESSKPHYRNLDAPKQRQSLWEKLLESENFELRFFKLPFPECHFEPYFGEWPPEEQKVPWFNNERARQPCETNADSYYECDDSICSKGEQCCNRAITNLKHEDFLRVVKTSDRGYGVETTKELVKDQRIVLYKGKPITQQEWSKKQWDSVFQRSYTLAVGQKSFYMLKHQYIDAFDIGNIARFVNHSCMPNCRMEGWIVKGHVCFVLIANRVIKKKEELTFDYREWPGSENLCRCGSTNCRSPFNPHRKVAMPSIDVDPWSYVEIAGDSGDGASYCKCRGREYGEMVACDNENCPYEWFHYECVGLTTAPVAETWFCKSCARKRS